MRIKVSNKAKDIILIIVCLAVISGILLTIGIFASSLFAQTNRPQIEKKILSEEDEERVERVVAWLSQKREVTNENI